MTYQFFICDVFTKHAFQGNQLAVLPEASGLNDEQMQQIAREFNFSETTFVFPPEQGQTKRVRIFTPTSEVPFAGHPNLGTAFTLYRNGYLGDVQPPLQVVFEEEAGLVSCRSVSSEQESESLLVALSLEVTTISGLYGFASAKELACSGEKHGNESS